MMHHRHIAPKWGKLFGGVPLMGGDDNLLAGLSSFWAMEEASGNRADSHGSNTLAAVGNPGLADGVHGDAVVLSSGNYLRCNSSASLQSGNISFTIAARVYFTTLSAQKVVAAKGASTDLNSVEYGLTTVLYQSNVIFGFDIWQGGTVQSITSTSFGYLAAETWYDVIAWVDVQAGTINIEVNGVLNSAAKTKTPVAGSAGFSVGAYYNGTAPAPIRVDDLGFWQRKLSATERARWRSYTYPFDGSEAAAFYSRVDLTVSGQAAMYLLPTVEQSGTLVIYHHGVGETKSAWLDDALKYGVCKALLQQGHILAGSTAHGNNWGIQLSITDYINLYNDAAARYAISKVVFLSQSMGGLSGLLCVADGTIPVAGWYGIYPVCNLKNMYDAGTFTAVIRSEYGIAADDSDYDARTAGHDPVLLSGALFTIPMRFTASASDTVVNKTANADSMSTLVAATTPEEAVVVCSGDHGDASHFQPGDVVAFFDRC